MWTYRRGDALSDILPLQNLKRLRRLTIQNVFLSPKLTDKVFISMVQSWPELELLRLGESNELSTTSLTSLGKLCPRLKGFVTVTYEAYDLTDWQNIPRPIFPQLQRLIIYGSVNIDVYDFLDMEEDSL